MGQPGVIEVLPERTVLSEVDHDRTSLTVVADDVLDASHDRIRLALFIHEPQYMPAAPALVTGV
jgi:hypothetical protein